MRDISVGLSGQTRDLDRVFPQLDKVSVRVGFDSVAGEENMVSAERAVPERQVGAERLEEMRNGAPGEVRGKWDEKEVSLFWIWSEEWATEERGEEDGFGSGGEVEWVG